MKSKTLPFNMKYNNIREEELKNKVGSDWFKTFDTTEILGNIDFTVFPKQDNLFGRTPLLWAEAKTGNFDIPTMFVQLILTIGKARTFDKTMPPAFLGAFDFKKIAFVPYINISDIFYMNDFNWNVTPSNHETKEFLLIKERIESILNKNTYVYDYEKDEKELQTFIKNNVAKATTANKLNLWDGTKWAPAGGGLKLAGDADLDVIPLQVEDASDGGSSFYLGTNSQYFTGTVGFGGDFGITGPQAALEIRTTTSGILLPRMTKDQRDAIGATAGLVIYQTDEVEGAYQYKNSGWEPIDPGDISGTAGRVARFVDNSIINNSSIFDDGENVWIGPTGSIGSSIFSVQSTTKGVSIPLMTTVQKEDIPTPADGLLVTESGTTGGLNQYIPGVGWVQYLHDNAGLTGGTQVISGNLVIEGTLSAEAKSFRIDNPEKPGHKLVYGVAEGPEHSVFFRGRSRNNRIEMPEEWKWLVDGRSITVQLTSIGKWSRLAVDRIENGIIYIKDQSPWSWFKKRQKLHFFYLVQAERKDIQKLDPNP